MKPLYMRLQAFGPFADSVTISFNRVFDGGLFLIHGRTGAGKTSLLDGLCFSLFGRPSAPEREKDMRALRSDLASAETLTETELVFAVGPVLYRVHRLPTQPTPKKRGEGFTELKASAELYQLQDSLGKFREALRENSDHIDLSELPWQPVAQKVEAVDLAVESLLGMNEQQFRQVVVLPQGKFREFLSSSSTERQAILEKLFQTDRFSRLQQFIASKAKGDESKWRTANETLQGKLEAAGLASADEIQGKKDSAQTSLSEETTLLNQARTRAHELAAELQRAREFQRTQIRLADLEKEARELKIAQPQQEARRELATRTRLWIPFFHSDDRARDLQTKSKALLDRRSLLESSLKSLSEKDQKNVAAKSDLENRKPSLEDLTQKRTTLRETAIALQDLEKSSQALDVETKKVAFNRENLSKAEAKNLELVVRRSAALVTAANFDREAQGTESRELETGVRSLNELELAFHRSEASRLAKLLKTGEPCLVCGSLSHPSPAHTREKEAPRVEDLDLAKQRVEVLRRQVTEARSKRATLLDSHREALELAYKTSVQPLALEGRADFQNAFALFERTDKELKAAVQDIGILKTEIQTREESLERAKTEIARKRSQLGSSDVSLAEIVKQGLALKAEQESREAEIKKTDLAFTETRNELSKISGQLSSLVDEIGRLETEIQLEVENREALKAQAPKPQPERQTEAALQNIERDVAAFNERFVKNKSALEELQTAAEGLQATRPLEQVTTEAGEAASLRDQLEASVARLRLQFENLVQLETESKSGLENLSRLQASADRSARLSALMAGDRSQNKLLVPLSRFVLQSRFEDVLEQANRRLGRMSRGQFQLRRPVLSRNLRDSQGLELSVEDAVAGKERHAGSLSGGESFMAALSLALGLADVVQADLGGVRLDTVLIDEGFGTLDSESLDLAMKTLIDLQAGGRMVGIISHVQELKSQIQEQLEVTKHASGSRIAWTQARFTLERN